MGKRLPVLAQGAEVCELNPGPRRFHGPKIFGWSRVKAVNGGRFYDQVAKEQQAKEMSLGFRMTLKAIIHNAEEGGIWAEVPALPGCLTQAETLDELKANLREAIELWLSVDDEVTESSVTAWSHSDDWKLASHEVAGSTSTNLLVLKGRGIPLSRQDNFILECQTRHDVPG
jgi:predicted RNase H-like HicB family nuclease